jgi:hypothetical protein
VRGAALERNREPTRVRARRGVGARTRNSEHDAFVPAGLGTPDVTRPHRPARRPARPPPAHRLCPQASSGPLPPAKRHPKPWRCRVELNAPPSPLQCAPRLRSAPPPTHRLHTERQCPARPTPPSTHVPRDRPSSKLLPRQPTCGVGHSGEAAEQREQCAHGNGSRSAARRSATPSHRFSVGP